VDGKKVAEESVGGEERCEGKEVDEDERHDEKLPPPFLRSTTTSRKERGW
jgi:hypothetical protein